MNNTYTAFIGHTMLATGPIETVVLKLKAAESDSALVFEESTGKQLDFDLRGDDQEVLARLGEDPRFARKAGRPKLGVVSREVSLLPRHWEWLEKQPGGASGSLRRLVEDARKAAGNGNREAIDAAGRFMWALAGNLPHFEDASRALYARDRQRLTELMAEWPADVRDHVERLLG